MTGPSDVRALTRVLALAGFLAADEEAVQLVARAAGDVELLAALVERRMTGEPLAWITGTTVFCDVAIKVATGVYVPRWLTEPLALRGAELLPDHGTAVDLCTGSGAIAKVLKVHRPRARVVASDVEPNAVACAIANGVDAYCGDLFAPLPTDLAGRVDVVVGVVPYVPTSELSMLQRDTFTYEQTIAYDGGADGMTVLYRVMVDSTRYLRDGGVLLLELGGDQAAGLQDELTRLGYSDMRVLLDWDGDVRGIEVIYGR